MDYSTSFCPSIQITVNFCFIGEVQNGNLKCTNFRRPGSHCLLQCDNGYEVSNTKFVSPTCNCKNHRCRWDKKRQYRIATCWPLPLTGKFLKKLKKNLKPSFVVIFDVSFWPVYTQLTIVKHDY